MSQTRPFVLETRDLPKCFARPAVEALDQRIFPGEFYIPLGAIGADKTTTSRAIAGLLPPVSGGIFVFRTDARADPIAAKRLMAWLSDEPMIYDTLSPLEYLDFIAGLWGRTIGCEIVMTTHILDVATRMADLRRQTHVIGSGVNLEDVFLSLIAPDPIGTAPVPAH